MNNYIIFTDTDTDLDIEMAAKYGYHLISMPYVVGDKEIYPYEDFKEFKQKEFYDTLRKGIIPKTCGIDPIKYKQYFEPFLKEGKDILYIHFSRAMSGTFQALDIALEDLKEKYPNNRVYTVDTKGITILAHALVLDAGEMYKEGKSINEIIDYVTNEREHYTQYFFADSLKFFARSGRVTNIAATMGNLIHIKPIIYMTQDGKMESISKARGRANAENTLLSYVDKLGLDIEKYRIVIGHTDSPALVESIKKRLEEKYPNATINVVVTNPTAGCHCGPDGVGICFHGIHR